MVTHRVEAEVGNNGPRSAPPSGAAATALTPGAKLEKLHIHCYYNRGLRDVPTRRKLENTQCDAEENCHEVLSTVIIVKNRHRRL
jgi:hypothetical protein